MKAGDGGKGYMSDEREERMGCWSSGMIWIGARVFEDEDRSRTGTIIAWVDKDHSFVKWDTKYDWEETDTTVEWNGVLHNVTGEESGDIPA